MSTLTVTERGQVTFRKEVCSTLASSPARRLSWVCCLTAGLSWEPHTQKVLSGICAESSKARRTALG